MALKGKVYCSDEGWGHLVREQAIVQELLRAAPGLELCLQTGKHADTAERLFPEEVCVIPRFNNIRYAREPDGNPDLEKTQQSFVGFEERSEAFLEQEKAELGDENFVISDFVAEAFAAAKSKDIPAFGACHFTWDWFFSKLYPPPVERSVLLRLSEMAAQATRIYFSFFSPEELVSHFGAVGVQVPLVVRRRRPEVLPPAKGGRRRVLIMDNGKGNLTSVFRQALNSRPEGRYEFVVSAQLIDESAPDLHVVEQTNFLAHHIPSVDLVLTRGGFNTISECIADRVPVLLLGESRNPEMQHNLLCLKESGLGSFVSRASLQSSFFDTLDSFFDNEYPGLSRRMTEHEVPCDGAEWIARDILDRVS